MDVSNISLVIQWRASCKITALWQWFGRAARDKSISGTAILLAEKEYFDDEQAAKAVRREKRKKTGKRAADDACLAASSRPKKRTAISIPDSLTSPSTVLGPHADDIVDSDDNSSDSDTEKMRTLPLDSRTTTDPSCEPGIEMLLKALGGRKQNIKGISQKRRELDPGVDYLINAENRPGLMCRRKIFDVCFDNDTAGGKITLVLMRSVLMLTLV